MSAPESLTPHDRAADPSGSVWVSASAGTGKTTALTRRVVALLHAGAEPEQILCLTYTNAAAAEMKRKVLDQLAAEMRKPSALNLPLQRVFVRLLERSDALAMYTIHGLCQRLLQLFPVEAGIAPGAEVLDEITAEGLRRSARSHVVLQRDQRNSVVADALERILQRMGDGRLAELLGQITTAGGRIAEWLEAASEDEIEARIGRALGVAPDDTAAAELAALTQLTPQRLADLHALADAWERWGGTTVSVRAQPLRDWLALDEAARKTRYKQHAALFLTADYRRHAKLFPVALAKQAPHLEPVIEREQALALGYLERVAAHAIARQSADLLIVCRAVLTLYRDRKDIDGVLDFQDLLTISWRLLNQSEMAPWILYKLDRNLRHMLIDEAQDTNRLQWDLTDALTAEFFTGEGQVRAVRTLCVVGDEKQSIFGFQGAEPAVFAQRRADYRQRLAAIGQTLVEVPLNRSFRSAEPVLKLVDAVFADAEARAAVASGPDQAIQHEVARHQAPGWVEVWPLFAAPAQDGAEAESDAEDDPESQAGGWKLPFTAKAVDDPERQLARQIVTTIRGWLDEGRRLAGTDRAIRPGDILILLRRRGRMMRHLSAELQRARIPTSGIDRFELAEHLAVRDLLALARVALNPLDDLSLAEVLKSPFLGCDEDTLLRLCHQRPASVWESLCAAPDMAPARQWLEGVMEASRTLTPLAFWHHVLDGEAGRHKLLARLGYDAAEVLDTFIEQVMQYERLHTPTLQGFVQWVEQGTVEVVRDAAKPGNYVRLMTVHSSKGLQAPIVFLADAGEQKKKPTSIVWADDETRSLCVWPADVMPLPDAVQAWKDAARLQNEAESLRLLYVALTRAADYLFICGVGDTATRKTSAKKDGENKPPHWHQRVMAAMQTLDGVVPYPFPGSEAGQQALRLRNSPNDAYEACIGREAGASMHGPAVEIPAFLSTPLPQPAAMPQWLRPSMAHPRAADAGWLPRLRGQGIHLLLQYLPNVPQAEWERVGLRLLEASCDVAGAQQHRQWLAEAIRTLQDPALAPLFTPESRAEVALVGSVDGVAVSAQIDRLLVHAGAVTCLEYKTTPTPARRQEDADPAHLAQVRWYRALLAARYPGRVVRTYLLYTAGPVLLEITG